MNPAPKTLLLIVFLTFFGGAAFSNTFIVTTNADAGAGSLRDAIEQAAANGTSSTDYIVFNISDLSLGGRTIDLQAELPALTSNLIIDGSTQPGPAFAITDAKIIIRKMNLAYQFSMLRIANASNVKIYGLYLYWGYWQWIFGGSEVSSNAVTLTNVYNFEFGAPGKGNVINGFTNGIYSGMGSDSSRNILIRSNFIGCGIYYTSNPSQDIDNFMLNMTWGIALGNARDCMIGGATPGEGNVICGTRSVILSTGYKSGNGFITLQNNRFSRWYDKQTLYQFGHFFAYQVHIGFDGLVLPGATGVFNDYKVQVLDNDIPMGMYLEALTLPFLIQRNHFENDSRDNQIPFKLAIGYCVAGGLIGGDDPSNANYFRFDTGNIDPIQCVEVSYCGPVTNLKNMYECNTQYGSSIHGTISPLSMPFTQVIQTSAGSVSGTATPQCRIDLYYDDECTGCEGKVYIGKTSSDASGNWQYYGPLNGTIVATATDSNGSTGDFSAPRFYTSNAKIIQPSCGKPNGSITGITSDGADSFYWKNLSTGAIVSNSIDLTNAGTGQYLLFGVHGGTCVKPINQVIYLGDQTPVLNVNGTLVGQPACGKFNGFISGTTISGSNNVLLSWINEQRQIISEGSINLIDVGPGKYKLMAKDTVTGCTDSTNFFELIAQTGPSININTAVISPATCNLSNGSITNIQYGNITGAASYSWLDSLGRIVANTPSLQNASAGKYRLKLKDASTCDTILTNFMTIENDGLVSFDMSGLQITASKCSAPTGAISDIAVTNGNSYQWKNILTGNIVSNSLDLLNVPAGEYRLMVTSINGCFDSLISIHIPQDTPVKITADFDVHNEACERKNGSISIKSLSPSSASNNSLEWMSKNNNQVISVGSSIQQLDSGLYSLYATDENGCKQLVSTIQLSDNPAPVISDAVILSETCGEKNGSILLTVSGSGPYVYSWSDQTGQFLSQSAHLTGVGNGSFSATISDANNCTTRTPDYVVNDSSLIIDPPTYPDQIILKGGVATIAPSNLAEGTYFLYGTPGNSPVQQNTNGSFVTDPLFQDTTLYIMRSEGNCFSAISQVHIKVVETLDITMPNAFTPNHDGLNDIFRLKYPQLVTSFHIIVFDRWGQRVYESNDPYKGWDGTLNAKEQPVGNYVWVIHYEDVLGNKKKESGNIVLIR
jgi:gliding motility-associated-like protein